MVLKQWYVSLAAENTMGEVFPFGDITVVARTRGEAAREALKLLWDEEADGDDLVPVFEEICEEE